MICSWRGGIEFPIRLVAAVHFFISFLLLACTITVIFWRWLDFCCACGAVGTATHGLCLLDVCFDEVNGTACDKWDVKDVLDLMFNYNNNS